MLTHPAAIRVRTNLSHGLHATSEAICCDETAKLPATPPDSLHAACRPAPAAPAARPTSEDSAGDGGAAARASSLCDLRAYDRGRRARI